LKRAVGRDAAASGVVRLLRFVPPGTRGKTRLARWLLTRDDIAGEAEVVDRFGLRFSLPSLAEPIAFHLLIDGVYEPDVLSFILAHLRTREPGAVFVDVGASVGALTIPVARSIAPSGRVVAVEASNRIVGYLSRNVAANGLGNVHCVHAAATEREGEVDFYEAPSDHFGMGSMGAQFHVQPSAVSGRPLDDILADASVRRVDLLKIDVEGFEAKVLSGAKHLLRGAEPPVVVFEFIDWAEARLPGGAPGDAQCVLRDWGFKIFRLKDFVRARKHLADILTTGNEMLVARRA
jgi:FkbM family methyltransferase